jgi:Na+/phosphate symporter
VSIESVNEDLARLERDVRTLSKDAGRLLSDVAGQSDTLRDEALAAEFLVTEETIENVGNVLNALSQLSDIQRQQLRVFVDDQRETIKALGQISSPADLVQIGIEHCGRRATHLVDGLSQTAAVLVNEGRAFTNTLVEMWDPFIDLVRRDWAGR